MYVWDIEFDTRTRGKGGAKHDERILVTVRNDSDADGVAESSDAVVSAANVTVEVRDSGGSLVGTLSGITDAAGLFTSSYLTNLPDDGYTAEVVALTHSTFVWNGDLDPTVNDGDADGDGLPDEQHTIPHSAGASAASTELAAIPTFNSFSTSDAGASTSGTNTDVSLVPIDTDRQPSLSTDDATTDDDSLTNREPTDDQFAIDDEAVDNLFADFNGSLLEDLLAV